MLLAVVINGLICFSVFFLNSFTTELFLGHRLMYLQVTGMDDGLNIKERTAFVSKTFTASIQYASLYSLKSECVFILVDARTVFTVGAIFLLYAKYGAF